MFQDLPCLAVSSRPEADHICVVRSPHTVKDVNLLEAVQRRAARWACGNRWDPTTSSWSLSHAICYLVLCTPTLCARHIVVVFTIQDIRRNNSIPLIS